MLLCKQMIRYMTRFTDINDNWVLVPPVNKATVSPAQVPSALEPTMNETMLNKENLPPATNKTIAEIHEQPMEMNDGTQELNKDALLAPEISEPVDETTGTTPATMVVMMIPATTMPTTMLLTMIMMMTQAGSASEPTIATKQDYMCKFKICQGVMVVRGKPEQPSVKTGAPKETEFGQQSNVSLPTGTILTIKMKGDDEGNRDWMQKMVNSVFDKVSTLMRRKRRANSDRMIVTIETKTRWMKA